MNLEQPSLTKEDKCLNCGYQLNAATCTDGHSSPEPGDVTVCIECVHIMAFDNDLSLRQLTDDEMIQIAGDSRLIRLVNAIGKANKEFKK